MSAVKCERCGRFATKDKCTTGSLGYWCEKCTNKPGAQPPSGWTPYDELTADDFEAIGGLVSNYGLTIKSNLCDTL